MVHPRLDTSCESSVLGHHEHEILGLFLAKGTATHSPEQYVTAIQNLS